MERKTVTIGGREVGIRKWPMRPAVRFGREASGLLAAAAQQFAEGKSDPFIGLARGLTAICDERAESLAVEMVGYSLDLPDRDEALRIAEDASIEDLAEVLGANLVFRGNPFGLLSRLSGLFGTPAPSAPGSESPSSTPSIASPGTT